MARIKRIVIHCTATPSGREVTIDDITRWHKGAPPAGHGWSHYGYHVLIHLDGSWDVLQQLPFGPYLTVDCMANGAKGYNHESLHVCYVGGIDAKTRRAADTRTDAQKSTLKAVIAWLRGKYGNLPVCGHRDLPGVRKACPCFNAIEEYYHE